jgi:hypothetical protein
MTDWLVHKIWPGFHFTTSRSVPTQPLIPFILFIYGLFYDAVRSSDSTEFSGRIINELERMWKEAVMAYLKTLSWHSPAETEENHEKPQDSQCPSSDLNYSAPNMS